MAASTRSASPQRAQRQRGDPVVEFDDRLTAVENDATHEVLPELVTQPRTGRQAVGPGDLATRRADNRQRTAPIEVAR